MRQHRRVGGMAEPARRYRKGGAPTLPCGRFPLNGDLRDGVAPSPICCQNPSMASTFARTLRASPTDAEMRLWSHRRMTLRLSALRMLRQAPLPGNALALPTSPSRGEVVP
jgi:hypothetical protein